MPDFKLEEMLSMISKWGIDKNANLSAVANYSALKKKLMLEKKKLVGRRAKIRWYGRLSKPACVSFVTEWVIYWKIAATRAKKHGLQIKESLGRKRDARRGWESDELPGAKQMREYQECKATGKLWTVAEFEDLPRKELNQILAYRGGQWVPTLVQGPLAAAADVGHDSSPCSHEYSN